jgi:hypothetical protein
MTTGSGITQNDEYTQLTCMVLESPTCCICTADEKGSWNHQNVANAQLTTTGPGITKSDNYTQLTCMVLESNMLHMHCLMHYGPWSHQNAANAQRLKALESPTWCICTADEKGSWNHQNAVFAKLTTGCPEYHQNDEYAELTTTTHPRMDLQLLKTWWLEDARELRWSSTAGTGSSYMCGSDRSSFML